MASYKIANFMGGINQAVDDGLLQATESKDAQNVDISNGDLRTIKGYAKYVASAVPAGVTRLMKFYKNNTTTGEVTSYLLAATATNVYYWNTSTSAWVSLIGSMTSGDWDYINYQITTVDYIFMGNGEVMKKWDGATLSDWGGNPPLAKSITLSDERVWVTGAKEYPNSVFYSDDIHDEGKDGITGDGPENWTGGEDEAGEVFMPTWDGGVCIGISTIFSDVVIFKTYNIWRILGTYPAVYEKKQVYSSVGAIAEKTIVSGNDRAYFMSKDGLYYYNGVSAYPLLGDKVKDIVINPSYVQNAVSIIYKNKLYCAFPEGASTTNNAVIVYDILQNNVMVWRGVAVSDFIEYDNKLLFSNATGYVFNLDNTTLTFDGTTITAYWYTPWTDLNAKNTVKVADTLYFWASGTADGTITITAYFDGKSKSKTVTLTANGKSYAIPFNIEGRRFRLKFANASGSDFVLKSPELTMDIDED